MVRLLYVVANGSHPQVHALMCACRHSPLSLIPPGLAKHEVGPEYLANKFGFVAHLFRCSSAAARLEVACVLADLPVCSTYLRCAVSVLLQSLTWTEVHFWV